MAETLDQRVAQAVYETSLLERALHDGSAEWSMRWRGVIVPAERVVSDHAVTFYASFPPTEETGDDAVWLLCNGAEVRRRMLEVRDLAPIEFDWTLSLDRQVPVEA